MVVRPGDSLKARLKTEVRRGYDKEDVSVRYYVTKVIDVIEGGRSNQALLFPEDEPPN